MYRIFVLFYFVFLCGCAVALSTQAADTSRYSFSHDLRAGSQGSDVQHLQQYLNAHGAPVALRGAGSPGNETTYFGQSTKAALIHFQELHAEDILSSLNIKKGTGNFYSNTRAFVNASFAENGEVRIPTASVNNRPFSEGHTISGEITGVRTPVTLQNNLGDTIIVKQSDNAQFIFSQKIKPGSVYLVTATSQLFSRQYCYVSKGTGIMGAWDVTDIKVMCTTDPSRDPFLIPLTSGNAPEPNVVSLIVPTITLAALNKTYGDSPFTITATTTSDGTLTYTSSNSSVAVVSGTMITIVGAGTSTISAMQAASSLYAASSTSTLLTVAKADPAISALSNFTFDSADYSGLCFEDFDTPLPDCSPDSKALVLNLPTSKSPGVFTALVASNSDVVVTTTNAVFHIPGYPVIDAPFYFGSLAFDLFNLLTPGPFSTTATLYQAATDNYNAASTTFTITLNLTQHDPDGNFCANHGVMMRPPWGGAYGEYECSCPSKFTGQYCQTVVP